MNNKRKLKIFVHTMVQRYEMVGYVLVFGGDNVSAEDRNTRFNKFFTYKNINNEEDML